MVTRKALLAIVLAFVLTSNSACSVEMVHEALGQFVALTPQADAAPAVETPTVATLSPSSTDGELTLPDLYSQVIPSVVSVQVRRRATSVFPFGTPSGQGEQYERGEGSGSIIDAERRLVLTNNHVVAGADVIEVVLHDGTTVRAELLGRDPDSDLAIVQLEKVDAPLQAVSLGDSDNLRVGQRAIAIGNPFGWQGTMTVGIISGLGRTLNLGQSSERVAGRFSIPQMIQTDAAINMGNSGGPLLDAAGRVIGVNTAIASSTGVSSGVGFAVPINTAKRVLPSLIEEGRYVYPWLGITGSDILPVHVQSMDLPVTRGAIVAAVVEDGPAAKAGLRGATSTTVHYGQEVPIGGDVIVAADDQPVLKFDDLLVYLIQHRGPGDTVVLRVIRDQQETHVPIVLEARPGQ